MLIGSPFVLTRAPSPKLGVNAPRIVSALGSAGQGGAPSRSGGLPASLLEALGLSHPERGVFIHDACVTGVSPRTGDAPARTPPYGSDMRTSWHRGDGRRGNRVLRAWPRLAEAGVRMNLEALLHVLQAARRTARICCSGERGGARSLWRGTLRLRRHGRVPPTRRPWRGAVVALERDARAEGAGALCLVVPCRDAVADARCLRLRLLIFSLVLVPMQTLQPTRRPELACGIPALWRWTILSPADGWPRRWPTCWTASTRSRSGRRLLVETLVKVRRPAARDAEPVVAGRGRGWLVPHSIGVGEDCRAWRPHESRGHRGAA